jgi:hypothetical protein
MSRPAVIILNVGKCDLCGHITTNGICDNCGWCVSCCVCGKVRQIDGTWMHVDRPEMVPGKARQSMESHSYCPLHLQIEYVKLHFFRYGKQYAVIGSFLVWLTVFFAIRGC